MKNTQPFLCGLDAAPEPDVTVTSFFYNRMHHRVPDGWHVVPEGALTAFGDEMFAGDGFRGLSRMTLAGCPRVLRGEIVIRHPHRFYVLNLQGLKALSIKQPWAWCIVRPDIEGPIKRAQALAAGLMKPVENREWKPGHPCRPFRGRFLIHAAKGSASKGVAQREFEQWSDDACSMSGANLPIPSLKAIDRGGIVGVATATAFVSEHDSNWFVGPEAFTLEDVVPLPFTPCTGMLGFFNPVFPEAMTKEPA